MGTIRVRFITVALVVSFFAVGMAAFLNYFKYKSTISGIVKSRVLVIGRNIENSVQASLSVGMQFMELGTMNALLTREKTSDRLIRGIDVFDHTGQIIYSTERAASVDEGRAAYWNYERFVRTNESRFRSVLGASGCVYAVRRRLYTPLAADVISDVAQAIATIDQGYRAVQELLEKRVPSRG